MKLGIDFGTSSTVAVLLDGIRIRYVFPKLWIPSAVCLPNDGGPQVGEQAVDMQAIMPTYCVPTPKKHIDEGTLLLGPEGTQQEVLVENAIAAILKYVLKEAEKLAGQKINDVTLTHPENWGSGRRGALVEAARLAGIVHPRLVAEPLAAYFARPDDRTDGITVVYDLGAGTGDICILEQKDGMVRVLGSAGIEIGGVDIDSAVMGLLTKMYQDAHPDLWRRLRNPQNAEERRAVLTLRGAIRRAKEALSHSSYTDFYVGEGCVAHLTRSELEEVARLRIAETITLLRRTLANAGLTPKKVSRILLVGGASRMPLVSTMLRQAGFTVQDIEQPETDVAIGCLNVPEHLAPYPPVPETIPEEAAAPEEPANTPAEPPSAPPPRRKRRWIAVLTALALIAGTVGVAAWHPWQHKKTPPAAVQLTGPIDLPGTTGRISSVDIAGDMVVATTDNTIDTWDATSGKHLWRATIANTGNAVLAGNYILVAATSSVTVLNANTGATVHQIATTWTQRVANCGTRVAWVDYSEVHEASPNDWKELEPLKLGGVVSRFRCSGDVFIALVMSHFGNTYDTQTVTANATSGQTAKLNTAYQMYAIDGNTSVTIDATGKLRVSDATFGPEIRTWPETGAEVLDLAGGKVAVGAKGKVTVDPMGIGPITSSHEFDFGQNDDVDAIRLDPTGHKLVAAFVSPDNKVTLRLIPL